MSRRTAALLAAAAGLVAAGGTAWWPLLDAPEHRPAVPVVRHVPPVMSSLGTCPIKSCEASPPTMGAATR